MKYVICSVVVAFLGFIVALGGAVARAEEVPDMPILLVKDVAAGEISPDRIAKAMLTQMGRWGILRQGVVADELRAIREWAYKGTEPRPAGLDIITLEYCRCIALGLLRNSGARIKDDSDDISAGAIRDEIREICSRVVADATEDALGEGEGWIAKCESMTRAALIEARKKQGSAWAVGTNPPEWLTGTDAAISVEKEWTEAKWRWLIWCRAKELRDGLQAQDDKGRRLLANRLSMGKAMQRMPPAIDAFTTYLSERNEGSSTLDVLLDYRRRTKQFEGALLKKLEGMGKLVD